MPEGDAQRRATEFVKDLYAAGDIDAAQLDTSVAGVLAARTEAELAGVMRSLPVPVALTSPDRRLTRPPEIKGGMGRMRLTGRWQIARETHVSADLGSVLIDLTEAEFDDRVVDLHVYTGWGSIPVPGDGCCPTRRGSGRGSHSSIATTTNCRSETSGSGSTPGAA